MSEWSVNRRSDGCMVLRGIDGWIIMPADEQLPVSQCPRCGEPFATVQHAQLIADALYPVPW